MKDTKGNRVLGFIIAVITMAIMLLSVVFGIYKWVDMYNSYEIQGESFTVECDTVTYNINENNYICTNDLYVVEFYYSGLLNMEKEYNIEVYYYQTHWVQWIDWVDCVKERQARKLVVR